MFNVSNKKSITLIVLAIMLVMSSTYTLKVAKTEFFVVNDMGCTHILSPAHKIFCYKLNDPEKLVLDEKETDFKSAYPDVF